ncbi:MAG: OB-fold domain-containing protein [Proteobacteria bacterium]|nr:OB-fold domain-containing protein [Pseudomonadota bacterium]
MSRGIAAWGAYLPRRRLVRAAAAEALAWRAPSGARARGERAYANWDEDSITLAVEAARDALGSRDRGAIDGVTLASTTLPFADRSNAGLVADALSLRDAVRTVDATGSQRAGTGALIDALASAPGRSTLVLAADRRATRAGSAEELAYGDGAAALLVADDGLAAEYLGSHSATAELVDHFRASDAAADYVLEERWVRTVGHLGLVPPAVATLLARLGLVAGDVRHFACPLPPASLRTVAKTIGCAEAAVVEPLDERCGHAGAAQPLLLLGAALERAAAGDLIVVVGFGQGVDVLALRATGAGARPARGVAGALAAGIADRAYVRFLAQSGALEMDWGLRAERDNRTAQSAYFRRHRDVTGFVGGRCRQCGTVQYPRAGSCVNPDCRALGAQDEVPLAGLAGTVKTFTEDWLAFTPSPPLAYGNVALAGGGNVFIEFCDVEPGELAVGAAVRFVFRIKDLDRLRDTRRYFWKATPVRH